MWFFKKKESRCRSIYDTTYQKLDELDPYRFNHVYSSDMSIEVVMTLFPNIEMYNSKLELIITALRNDIRISSFDVNTPSIVVSIGEFYLDSNRCYIDTTDATLRFIKNCRNLLQLYEKIEEDISNVTTMARNKMILSRIIQNIVQVVDTLSKLPV